jgi:hypothetical protein
MEAMRILPADKVFFKKRLFSEDWFQPSTDEFCVDAEEVFQWLKNGNSKNSAFYRGVNYQ